MSFERVLPGLWMNLPREERLYIAERFSIPRTGVTEVRDTEVLSDGFTFDDLAHINRDKMVDFIGSGDLEGNESFPRLWELTVAKARYEINPPPMVIQADPEPEDKPEPKTPKHVKAKKGE